MSWLLKGIRWYKFQFLELDNSVAVKMQCINYPSQSNIGWEGYIIMPIIYINNSFAFSTEQAFFIAAAAIEVIRLLTFLA